MAFPIYKTRQDLEQLLANGAVESTELEFKDSRSLVRDEGKISELCINVSALANSAGGQIIYGINENKKSKGPVVVDEGITDASITRDWISQILNARIKPRLTEYSIDQIDLHQGQMGFVISVPQTSTGPHQAPDNRYYRRIGIEVRAMEDYEVRDIMRRATTPTLYSELFFDGRQTAIQAHAQNGAQHSDVVVVHCSVRNKSNAPAYHVVVDFLVDYDLVIPYALAPFTTIGERDQTPSPRMRIFRRVINSPPDVPVFQESAIAQHSAAVPVQIPFKVYESGVIYFETEIHTPGFSISEQWHITSKAGLLRIVPPVDRRKPRQRWA